MDIIDIRKVGDKFIVAKMFDDGKQDVRKCEKTPESDFDLLKFVLDTPDLPMPEEYRESVPSPNHVLQFLNDENVIRVYLEDKKIQVAFCDFKNRKYTADYNYKTNNLSECLQDAFVCFVYQTNNINAKQLEENHTL
jgi:hypothetical protein